MAGFMWFVRSLALLLARLALGGILLARGWERWQVQGIDSQLAYLQQFGTPYPLYATWGAILAELVGGIFLIVGALTPLVAAAVLAEQVLIVAWTNWFTCPYVTVPAPDLSVGSCETNVGLAGIGLLLVVFGAGGASVDRLFRRERPTDEETYEASAPAATSSSRRR